MAEDKEIAFRKAYLLNKEELVKSIELIIEYYQYNDQLKYSDSLRENVVTFFNKFLSSVKKMHLPQLEDLWKFYDYDIMGDRVELNLCEEDPSQMELDKNGNLSQSGAISTQLLYSVQCECLTIEEYAERSNVRPATVEGWIKKGKLKNAKFKDEEWLIPILEERPTRKYKHSYYILPDNEEILIEEFPLLRLSKLVWFDYDEVDKKVIVTFRNFETDFNEELRLSKQEAEELEHQLIRSGKADIGSRVQFIPDIGKG